MFLRRRFFALITLIIYISLPLSALAQDFTVDEIQHSVTAIRTNVHEVTQRLKELHQGEVLVFEEPYLEVVDYISERSDDIEKNLKVIRPLMQHADPSVRERATNYVTEAQNVNTEFLHGNALLQLFNVIIMTMKANGDAMGAVVGSLLIQKGYKEPQIKRNILKLIVEEKDAILPELVNWFTDNDIKQSLVEHKGSIEGYSVPESLEPMKTRFIAEGEIMILFVEEIISEWEQGKMDFTMSVIRGNPQRDVAIKIVGTQEPEFSIAKKQVLHNFPEYNRAVTTSGDELLRALGASDLPPGETLPADELPHEEPTEFHEPTGDTKVIVQESGTNAWDVLRVLVPVVGVIGGFLLTRRRKGKFSKYLKEVDSVYAEYKLKTKRLEAELYRLRDIINEEVHKGKIDEAAYSIIEKRIEKYLVEAREQEINDRFGGLPQNLKNDLQQRVKEGHLSQEEYEKMLKVLEDQTNN